MQEIGSVQSGAYYARVQGATSKEQSDDDQVRHGSDGTSGRKSVREQIDSSVDIKLGAKEKFWEKPDEGSNSEPDEDSSSEKLKDALLVSFIDWISGHLNSGSVAPAMSAASKNKLLKSANGEIDSAESAGRMAREIASNRPMSLLVQANVGQDTALHLLSAGTLAEAVQEPDQKQHTLFDADYMDVRTKVSKISHRPT